MIWEYRVTKSGAQCAETYEIREIYYDAGQIIAWSAEPDNASGDDLEQLAQDLARMSGALSKPVLDLDALAKAHGQEPS